MPDGQSAARTMLIARASHPRLVSAHSVVRRIFSRFLGDRCFIGASALSYTTIVSMVPLTAIMLVVFSWFSKFGTARDRLLSLILNNFAPSVGQDAAAWFASVAGNAAQTTAIGIVALVVTSILLLATIEEHLHFIFRVSEPRSWGQRVLAYWTVLTLGPILVGVGISVSGLFDGILTAIGSQSHVGEEAARAGSNLLGHIVTPLLELVAFTALYRFIPNRRVAWRACLIGAVVATVALEVLKFGFGIYIARMSSYSTVYGALAGIPIALLWMYIFWLVVLFGAETAATLVEPKPGQDTQVSVETVPLEGV